MKIALASPPIPLSLASALTTADQMIQEAAGRGADIICFPESYLPGYPLPEFNIKKASSSALVDALDQVGSMARQYKIAVIMPMDWYEAEHIYNVAHVIDADGELLGKQTKNQLDPSEDPIWIPGTERAMFEIKGVKFGITICHEGFRYPESVRWAAKNGAQIVFHPNCTGSNAEPPAGKSAPRLPTEWGEKESPYYEKAQMMRAMENTIYFASSNYSFKYPESASALIAPDGSCVAFQEYGHPGVLVAAIDPAKATGLLAKRFRPQL